MVELEKLLRDVFGFDVEIVDIKAWWDGDGINFDVGVTLESFRRIRSWIIENVAENDSDYWGGIYWGNFYFYVRGDEDGGH